MLVAEKTLDKSAFRLKGGLYTLTALQITGLDFDQLQTTLKERIAQAPRFFKHAPVVIDLIKVNNIPKDIDFDRLKNILNSLDLIPVGVRGGDPKQNKAATEAGLPVLPEAKSQPDVESENTSASTPPIPSHASLLITHPVRSGQQVYAKGGDLIIHGTVSPGAEVLADGHIHIYGTLRGRALAGVHGDQSARIFCHELQAELLSIAGQYSMRDDLKTDAFGSSVCVSLQDNHLHVEVL